MTLLYLIVLGSYAFLKARYSQYKKVGSKTYFLLGGTPRENFLISPLRNEGYPVTFVFSLTAAWFFLVIADLYAVKVPLKTAFYDSYTLLFLVGGGLVFGLCLLKYFFIRIIPARKKSAEASEIYYHEYMQFSRTGGFILFLLTGLLLSASFLSEDFVKNALKICIGFFVVLRPLYIVFKLRFFIPLQNLLNFSYFCTLETIPAVFILKIIA